MTFDCYGTLLDWQSGFRRILAPVAGERIEALVEAFHAVEPEVEREVDARTRTILREGVARAAARAGVELPDRDLLVDGWHTLEAFPDTVAGAARAAGAGLEARHPDQLRRRPLRRPPGRRSASRSTSW